MGAIFICISRDDGLLGLTFIFAKLGYIVTLFSLAYWFMLLFVMFRSALSSSLTLLKSSVNGWYFCVIISVNSVISNACQG